MTSENDRPEKESLDNRNNEQESAAEPKVSKILIGSQRNPEAYRPQPTVPVLVEGEEPHTVSYPPEGGGTPAVPVIMNVTITPPEKEYLDDEEIADHLFEEGTESLRTIPAKPTHRVQVPSVRKGTLEDDLEDEFNAVFGNRSFEALMDSEADKADRETLEPDTKLKAKVLSIQGDSVFLDVGAREQGVVSLKLFPPDAEPKQDQEIEVTVVRFLPVDGLYEVSVPLAAADVRDWSQVQEGMIVEARITKTNTGGLECEVNRLRGFIPVSQIDIFRVEDLEQYVGQKMTCIVEEVNPERRNLVLSRRAMINREREEQKKQLLTELEVGQTREGLVRKIIDGGAFVDLGGVDGFIPISKMAWGRIRHPSDVLTEGTRIKVRIDRIEEGTNKISLVYRDDASNPWSNVSERFQPKTVARGKVTKIMDFGAFVELMPGLEGLVHISELSPKRVNNVREVVKEGEWVEVFIVSIDPDGKRIGLSIKQAAMQNVPAETSDENRTPGSGEEDVPEIPKSTVKVKNPHKGPLRGGTGSSSGGEAFGLKW